MRNALVALSIAVSSLAPGLASATPTLSASAGTTSSNTIGNCTGGGSGSSSGPIAFHLVCGDSTGAAEAGGFASIGHVGGEASAAGFSPFSGFSTPGASASFFDTVIFTAVDPSAFPGGIPVSVNLSFTGTLNSSGVPHGSAEVRGLVQIAGVTVASYRDLNSDAIDILCTSSFAGGAGCGSVALGDVTTGDIIVPLGVPIGFLFSLEVSAGSSGAGSGVAHFGNSLDLPTGINVFNLPGGVTANAPGSDIVNNRFVLPVAATVPEPASLLLLGSGLAGFAAVTWRRRRRN